MLDTKSSSCETRPKNNCFTNPMSWAEFGWITGVHYFVAATVHTLKGEELGALKITDNLDTYPRKRADTLPDATRWIIHLSAQMNKKIGLYLPRQRRSSMKCVTCFLTFFKILICCLQSSYSHPMKFFGVTLVKDQTMIIICSSLINIGGKKMSFGQLCKTQTSIIMKSNTER